jgi:hypothetical protein
MLIPKQLIEDYFKCKYIYYKEKQKYETINRKFPAQNVNSFEYNVYLTNPKYYKELIIICDKIKQYIKSALDTAINLENNCNQIKLEHKYYKLTIKYAYDDNGAQYYETPIFKATSILQVYKHLLFDKEFEDIKLLEVFIGMSDCFNISKIPEYDTEFHILLWLCDSYTVNNINMFAQYDETLRNRYDSIEMELDSLNDMYTIEELKDITFKYPKSESDKINVTAFIKKTRLTKNVLPQLYKCDILEPIVLDDIEYYDLLVALNNFFSKDFMNKLNLTVLEENQVYITI